MITTEEEAIAAANGINYRQLYTRIVRLGWDRHRAMTQRVKPRSKISSAWVELAEKNGIDRKIFHERMRAGWTPVRAARTPVKRGDAK